MTPSPKKRECYWVERKRKGRAQYLYYDSGDGYAGSAKITLPFPWPWLSPQTRYRIAVDRAKDKAKARSVQEREAMQELLAEHKILKERGVEVEDFES
jgi:hypothetical protein